MLLVDYPRDQLPYDEKSVVFSHGNYDTVALL